MIFNRNEIENLYCQSLIALKFIFEQTKVISWAKWIDKDLYMWEQEKSVQYHMSAYGGMGSLNDLVICTENRHMITKEQVPWVNSLLLDLCALSYTFAVSLRENKNITKESAVRGMGNYGFCQIQGWRCLCCGYAELSLYELECYVARVLVRKSIIDAMLSNTIVQYTKKVFQQDIQEVNEYRENLKEDIMKSNINISNRKGWLRPCPRCGSEDTAVYRWEKEKRRKWLFLQVGTFVPSADNLKLR